MRIFFISLAVIFLFIFFNNQASAQCAENFDGVTAPALPAGWSAVTLTDCTGSNPWVTSTTTPSSAPNAAFVTAPACVSDEVLVSRQYLITSSTAQLTFRRRHGLEAAMDGLVLEISINGGSFEDISYTGSFGAGGYNTILNSSGNPLAGREAWSGSTSNAYVTTTVNLPASVIGKVVVFRWRRGTNASVSGTGVYIDNISLTGCSISVCAENFDGITAPALPSGWIAFTARDCTGSNPWATVNNWSHTVPNAAYVSAADCVSDEYLYSKVFQIVSATAQINFRRSFSLESNFDGLVLEISIGGAPFVDIQAAGGLFITGGYNGVISNCCGNPLGGRSAWTGNVLTWTLTTINLPASANGKTVILRWRRGTDSSTPSAGAHIDGLSITGSLCSPVCATRITLTPAGGNLCSTNPIVLTASVAGASYEWYRNDVKIDDVSGNTYSAISSGIYYAKAVIGGCLVTSNVSVLDAGTETPALNGGGVYCPGSSVSLTVPESKSTQDYTWKKNGVVVYGPVTGNDGPLSYNFNMDAGMVGDYSVETYKPGCVGVVSNIAYVRLSEQVTGLTTEQVCPNQAIIKWNKVIPNPFPERYEYHLSESSTPPSSGSQVFDSVITLPVNPSTLYYFYVRSYCEGSTGTWSSISFTTPVQSTLTLSPANATICNGSPVTLTASGGGSSYALYWNGSIQYGSNSPTFTISTSGTYTVTSEVNGCTLTSNPSVINTATLFATTLSGSGVYCAGELVDLRTTTQPSQQYSWYSSSGSLVYGPVGGGNGGNQSYVLTMSAGAEGSYYVKTTSSGCERQSNSVIIYEAAIKNLIATKICSNQASFSWDFIPTDFQYVVDQNSSPPVNPSNPIFTNNTDITVNLLLPATTYYIHVRARANNSANTDYCSNWTTLSFTTEPENAAEWTGELSTNWFDGGNWKCGTVPGPGFEVVVNAGKPNYPVITSNTTIKKLTVNSGASVNVSTGVTLTITSQ